MLDDTITNNASPLELVFGRNVRGPVEITKEKWLEDDGPPNNLLDYVTTLKDRTRNTGEATRRNLRDSQERMKTWGPFKQTRLTQRLTSGLHDLLFERTKRKSAYSAACQPSQPI